MSQDPPEEITPQVLLQAYASGVFPMADSADDPDIFWVDPQMRGVLPLDGFHISRSLKRRIKQKPFHISYDTAFDAVVVACADRKETWINNRICRLYHQLHQLGFAHSVEVWADSKLVGGVYGVALGGAFFGESMFSRRTDGSKIALAYLVSRLRFGGFALFDAQFLTDHLESLGAVEIPRAEYHERLIDALSVRAEFHAQPQQVQPSAVLQANNQTS